MKNLPNKWLFVFCWSIFGLLITGCTAGSTHEDPGVIRFMTFNVEDVRTTDILGTDHPRLQAAASIIQTLRPDILLINEIAYDQKGVAGYDSTRGPGNNARRFATNYLAVSQGDGLEPLQYAAFMAPSNTGLHSGFDLDRSGDMERRFPPVAAANEDGSPARQTPEGRAYGNDSWGFGTFPGQYGMALFVKEGSSVGATIVEHEIRTFQHFRWADLPEAMSPSDPATDLAWYSDEVWPRFPLSSKSHWDVPVRLRSGAIIHVLASHPTPPAFDGPEGRNKHRNRAEIEFWNTYVSNADFIYDDNGAYGGLETGESFVIMGDLNADPDEGGSIGNPIGTFLFDHPRINGSVSPVADSAGIAAFPDLDPDDTAGFRMRVDYVLPSADLGVIDSGMFRWTEETDWTVGDHFPVWLDVRVPDRP